jgi:hypothetical protein
MDSTTEERSHESREYDTRFMLRLDGPSQTKLQQLMKQFGASKAKIIRQLIAQSNDDDFPRSWHMRAAERRTQQSGNRGTSRDGRPMP